MANVEVDAREVNAMFAELEPRRRKQAFRATMSKASNILVRETRKTLGEVVADPKAVNWWNGKKLQDGIKRSVARDAKSAKVHLLGDFRLKFFEMSTKDRYTKSSSRTGTKATGIKRSGKGGYRGRIEGKYFFKKAKQSTERRIFESIETDIAYQINRINNKYN